MSLDAIGITPVILLAIKGLKNLGMHFGARGIRQYKILMAIKLISLPTSLLNYQLIQSLFTETTLCPDTPPKPLGKLKGHNQKIKE